MHHIYLIPGFFGFANFGEIKYFSRVREVLENAFADLGESAEIYYVKTAPTASLLVRASAVVDAMAGTRFGVDDAVHLAGHSTGGLDARLVSSPGVVLPTEHPVDDLSARIRSVVSVATPHHGTPQASLFATLAGQQLLKTLSILTLHGIRLGSVPLSAMVALAGVMPRVGQWQTPVLGVLDQVYRQLLRDFDAERRIELERFLGATNEDQRLLQQLSPECVQLLNATTSKHASARYGCVVAQARPPTLRASVALGLSPTSQAAYSLYRALYELASGMPTGAVPDLDATQEAKLIDAFGSVPDAKCNDAIVPTRSQVWGEVIHAVWADHHDVIGHFTGPEVVPPHVDWLATQSHFTRPHFEALWRDVAQFMLAGAD